MAKKIFVISAVRYTQMHVEADTIEEALNIARDHVDQIPLEEYADSENSIDSYDTFPQTPERWMQKIYTKSGVVPAREYIENQSRES